MVPVNNGEEAPAAMLDPVPPGVAQGANGTDCRDVVDLNHSSWTILSKQAAVDSSKISKKFREGRERGERGRNREIILKRNEFVLKFLNKKKVKMVFFLRVGYHLSCCLKTRPTLSSPGPSSTLHIYQKV